MALHTWNKADPAHPSWQLCRDCLQRGDALLLLEDGVYLLLDAGFRQWLANNPWLPCHAMLPDLAVRGLSDRMPPAIVPVDYSGFVTLSLSQDKVVSWG